MALIASKRKLWHRAHLYIKVGWEKKQSVAKLARKDTNDADYNFRWEFRENDAIFKCKEKRLWVVDFPMELD